VAQAIAHVVAFVFINKTENQYEKVSNFYCFSSKANLFLAAEGVCNMRLQKDYEN